MRHRCLRRPTALRLLLLTAALPGGPAAAVPVALAARGAERLGTASGGGTGSGGGAETADAAAAARIAGVRRWHDPDFFDSFSEGESTYDEDGDHGRMSHVAGWEPGLETPGAREGNGAEWFHESPSGGPDHAWQTHYPALQTGLAGGSLDLGRWYKGPAGEWIQEYKEPEGIRPVQDGAPSRIRAQKLPAAWFDSAVAQRDGFGRRKAPSGTSSRRFVDWKERSVNMSLACALPGCIASAGLYAFDGARERARQCRLNIDVKHYSGDRLEWISVGGANVSLGCQPPASPCNDSASARPLYPCVMDLDLDKLLPMTGTLEIAAKIPDTADAGCTYEGNLLVVVPMVTCLVQELKMLPASLTDLSNAPLPDPDAPVALVALAPRSAPGAAPQQQRLRGRGGG